MQTLLAGPRAHLTAADVDEALSLDRGATLHHGVDVLDLFDRPTEQVLRFETGSITWGYRAPDRVVGQSDETAAVRRRGSLTIDPDVGFDLLAGRLRPWSELQLRTGQWARFHHGVFRVTNPGALVDDGSRRTRTLQLLDKSHLWNTTYLDGPLIVPAGTAVVGYVRNDLAARFGETRDAITSSAAVLGAERVFEPGTSLLQVYSRLFEAIAYDQLTADETGRPSSRPLSDLAGKGPEVTYGAGQGKVLRAGQLEPLLPTLPNVVRFSARQGPSLGNTEGNGLAIRRNQSTGPASIDARAGQRVTITVDVDTDSQPMLEQIADADCQRYFSGGGLRWSGRVGLNPRHSDRDVIGIDLPRLGVRGDAWAVTEWTYPLSQPNDEQAVTMPVTAELRVSL